MNIKDCISHYSKILDSINNDYKISFLEVNSIFMYVLNMSKTQLISNSYRILTEEEKLSIENLINRRLKYEPLAYLINRKEFYGYDFYVDENVLIPRPETEELIDLVRDYIGTKNTENISVIDIGSGSGNISITLKKLFRSVDITALDISIDAINVLKKNVDFLLDKSINIINADALIYNPYNKFDIVVSNAPYVPLRDKEYLQKDLEYEPEIALYSGYDGLNFYKSFLYKVNNYIKKSGAFFFEIGYDQGDLLLEIANDIGIKNVSVKKDLSGRDRFLICDYFDY